MNHDKESGGMTSSAHASVLQCITRKPQPFDKTNETDAELEMHVQILNKRTPY